MPNEKPLALGYICSACLLNGAVPMQRREKVSHAERKNLKSGYIRSACLYNGDVPMQRSEKGSHAERKSWSRLTRKQ